MSKFFTSKETKVLVVGEGGNVKDDSNFKSYRMILRHRNA